VSAARGGWTGTAFPAARVPFAQHRFVAFYQFDVIGTSSSCTKAAPMVQEFGFHAAALHASVPLHVLRQGDMLPAVGLSQVLRGIVPPPPPLANEQEDLARSRRASVTAVLVST
jgi:hypothetical protein